jgi:hypothetical protein
MVRAPAEGYRSGGVHIWTPDGESEHRAAQIPREEATRGERAASAVVGGGAVAMGGHQIVKGVTEQLGLKANAQALAHDLTQRVRRGDMPLPEAQRILKEKIEAGVKAQARAQLGRNLVGAPLLAAGIGEIGRAARGTKDEGGQFDTFSRQVGSAAGIGLGAAGLGESAKGLKETWDSLAPQPPRRLDFSSLPELPGPSGGPSRTVGLRRALQTAKSAPLALAGAPASAALLLGSLRTHLGPRAGTDVTPLEEKLLAQEQDLGLSPGALRPPRNKEAMNRIDAIALLKQANTPPTVLQNLKNFGSGAWRGLGDAGAALHDVGSAAGHAANSHNWGMGAGERGAAGQGAGQVADAAYHTAKDHGKGLVDKIRSSWAAGDRAGAAGHAAGAAAPVALPAAMAALSEMRARREREQQQQFIGY